MINTKGYGRFPVTLFLYLLTGASCKMNSPRAAYQLIFDNLSYQP
jgi:hypothetical protein